MRSNQKGFAPIFILIIIAIIVIILFNNPSIKDRFNISKQSVKQENNILNRAYYVWKDGLYFIDAGSGEKGKISLQARLPETSDYLTKTNPFSTVQLTPDKRTLIFVKDDNLWRVDVDGNNFRQLTSDGIPYDKPECPVRIDKFFISPDSKNIYYLLISDYYTKGGVIRKSDGKACSPTLKNERQESVLDLNGVKQKFIGPENQDGRIIGWAPDSKSLYYSYTGGYSGENGGKVFKTGLIIHNPQTGTSTDLLKEGVSRIYWDNGAMKAFIIGESFAYRGQTLGSINLIDSNFKILGSYPARIGVPEGEAMLNTGYKWFWWKANSISPDGKFVVLTKIPQEHFATGDSGWNDNILSQYSEVYLWDTNTKEQIKLPFTVDAGTTIKWTNDGAKLIYHIVRKDVDQGDRTSDSDALYVYDLQSKKQTLLIDFYNDLRGAYNYLLL